MTIGEEPTNSQKVQKLQAALHAKAKETPTFRFYALYDKVYRQDVLHVAFRQCRSNDGRPGVDGQTFEQIIDYGVERWLGELAEELRTKQYQPQAVRRVWIPKPDGKQRPLGIPTIKDRVVQTALLLVLEPIFEADLPPEQYAYREGRGALDAVREVHRLACFGHSEVVDADLSGYFDSIPHAELMRCIARRVSDKAVLHLVKLWLDAPVEETDERGHTQRTTRNRDEGRGSPQGAPSAPPTKVQNLSFASILTLGKKGEVDAIDDADLSGFDDDSVDQSAEDFATCGPVGLRQVGADRFTEAIHAGQRFTQGGLFARLEREYFQFRLHVGKALAGPRKTRLELLAIDQAVGVDVDQALQRALRGGEMFAQGSFRLRRFGRGESPFVFLAQQLRVAEQFAGVVPHRLFDVVRADLRILTNALATEAIGVGPDTAIVHIRRFALRAGAADRLAIKGIAAALTFEQSLQQVLRAAFSFAAAQAVLGKLLTHAGEQFGRDDCRNRDRDLFDLWSVIGGTGSARNFRLSARLANLGASRPRAGLAERRRTPIRRVFQDRPDGRAIPPGLPCGAGDTAFLEPPAHFADRQTIAPDPVEDLLHDGCALIVDFVGRLAVSLAFADVAITKGRSRQHVHAAARRGVTFATTTAFHDLCAFVFGEHALHLQQQVFFRTDANGAIQKRNLNAELRQFVHEQHLIRVAPRESIGRMDIQFLKAPGIGGVAQPFQRRTQQRRATHAVVEEAEFLGQRKPLVGDALPQGRDLAGDRVLLRLLLRRNPRVDRDAQRGRVVRAHAALLVASRDEVVSTSRDASCVPGPTPSCTTSWAWRCLATTHSNTCVSNCRSIRDGENCRTTNATADLLAGFTRRSMPQLQNERLTSCPTTLVGNELRPLPTIAPEGTKPVARDQPIPKSNLVGNIVGGAISPLFANLYMRRFVLGWKQLGHEQRLQAKIVNYADDFVILCRGSAKQAMAAMRDMMQRLKLTVNEAKTRICKLPAESFDFLSYTIGMYWSWPQQRMVLSTRPSAKAVKRLKVKISETTDRDQTLLDAGTIVTRLNQMLAGWANYFCRGPVSEAYRTIDFHVRQRIRRWLVAKHKGSGRGISKYPNEYLYEELGLIRLATWRANYLRGRNA